MYEAKTSLNQASVLILTTCSPADDPRSFHWANSCLESFGGQCSIVYPSLGRTCPREDFKSQTIDQIEIVSFNLASFSRKKIWAYLDKVNDVQTAHIVDRLQTSVRFDSTEIHRTLVEQCLDEIVVATLSLLTCAKPKIIIGTDIQGLCGASVFGSSGVQTIYDAQEITIHGFPGLNDLEIEFWRDFEKDQLLGNISAVTVSPGIAKWHESEFDVVFEVVPNFEPLKNGVTISTSTQIPVKYVYYGGCAPEKNLKQLLMSWNISKQTATLCVVAKENSDRLQLEDFWRSLNFRDSEVTFFSYGDATNVCEFLKQFDVGVLPYNYEYPYSEASPNKFGQYIAAGLAVVANHQGFVSELVVNNGLGHVVDLSNPREAANQLLKISDPKTIDNFKFNALRAFQDDLHWENYAKVLRNLADIRCAGLEVSHPLKSSIEDLYVGRSSRLMEFVRYLLRKGVLRVAATRLGAILASTMSKNTILSVPKRLLNSMIDKRPK